MYKNYNIIPGIVSLESNERLIPMFYYAGQLKDKLGTVETHPILKVKYSVMKDIKTINGMTIGEFKNKSIKFSDAYYLDDVIYYEKDIGFGLIIKLCFINDERNPELIVNKAYSRFVKANVDTVYAVGRRLGHIIHTKLLEKGFATIHAAATSYNNQAILLMAPSNTGKTMTALSSILRNYKFISEDICITDGKKVYGCPLNYVFESIYEGNSTHSINRLYYTTINKLSNFIPILSYCIGLHRDTIADKFEIDMNQKSENKTTFLPLDTRYIFILSSQKHKKFDKLDSTEAFHKIWVLQKNEFSYLSDSIISAYYLNSNKNSLYDITRTEEKIIKEIVDKCYVYEICSSSPKDYIHIIDRIIKNK